MRLSLTWGFFLIEVAVLTGTVVTSAYGKIVLRYSHLYAGRNVPRACHACELNLTLSFFIGSMGNKRLIRATDS